MRVGTFRKQPREKINVLLHYEAALDPNDGIERVFPARVEGETPLPDGRCTLGAVPLRVSGTDARVWLVGGDDGARYKVTVKVGTKRGEVLEDEIKVRVREI